jgi:hypothetical protein
MFKFPALLTAILVVIVYPSFGQSQQAPSLMTMGDFDAWVSGQMQTSADASFCRVVLDRLKGERYTSDATILRCVEKTAASEQQAGSRFRNTIQFIDDLLGIPEINQSMKGKLTRRKGTLLIQLGDFAGATRQFTEALKYTDPIRLEADREHVTVLVNLGQSLLSSGKKSDAEQYFLLALSYPWYTVLNHPEELQQLRDLYVQAGRGLIEVRRGNAAALRSIVFVPASMNELGPVLEKAIQEAPK